MLIRLYHMPPAHAHACKTIILATLYLWISPSAPRKTSFPLFFDSDDKQRIQHLDTGPSNEKIAAEIGFRSEIIVFGERRWGWSTKGSKQTLNSVGRSVE